MHSPPMLAFFVTPRVEAGDTATPASYGNSKIIFFTPVDRIVEPNEWPLASAWLRLRWELRYGVDGCKFGKNYLDPEQ